MAATARRPIMTVTPTYYAARRPGGGQLEQCAGAVYPLRTGVALVGGRRTKGGTRRRRMATRRFSATRRQDVERAR